MTSSKVRQRYLIDWLEHTRTAAQRGLRACGKNFLATSGTILCPQATTFLYLLEDDNAVVTTRRMLHLIAVLPFDRTLLLCRHRS